MQEYPSLFWKPGECLLHHPPDHLHVRLPAYGISEYFPVVQVEYGGKIHLLSADVELGNVRDQFPSGHPGMETTFQQIGCGLSRFTLVGKVPFASDLAVYIQLPHQFEYGFWSYPYSGHSQRQGYPAVSVPATVDTVNFGYPLLDFRILIPLRESGQIIIKRTACHPRHFQ